MQLLNFTIIKLTICLVVGILLAHYLNLDFQTVVLITIGVVILLGIYWLTIKSKISRSPVFGCLAFLALAGIGMTSYYIQDEKLRPNHYTNLNPSDSLSVLTLQIRERLKPDAYNDKYIAKIIAFNKEQATGQVLVNFRHDSGLKHYNVDDIIFTSTELQEVQQPLNPHQFDYRSYLELNQVYHQVYLKSDEVLQLSNSKISIYGYADHLRTKINAKLTASGFKSDALSIMNALLLGQRQTIDKSIYNNYVNSGTIHILAVSGLHVGIILLILDFLLNPLLRLKIGRIIKPIILVAFLWCFAVIAGLSPSVTRAVTMFSILSIAMHLKRPTNIYNTLVISAFFILLVKPTMLFAVGFQMSYLAVLGIVSVQPLIYKLWQPRYYIPHKFWQIFTVTLAAQIGVVPISLFYFHQFPGLFFISNLVVIPFLGIILGFGLLIIALALLNVLPHILVLAYSFIIDSLNDFIAWIAQFEAFLFRDIPFSLTHVLFSYLIIIALIQFFKHPNFKWLMVSLIGIISFQCFYFYNKFKTRNDALIVFNKSRYSLLGQIQNNRINVYHNLDSASFSSDNILKNYKVGESIREITSDSLHSVFMHKNKTLLIIDSMSVYKGLSFQPNYILLRNSPRLNLNRVIDSLKPQKIIADASNYKSYLKRWKATCEAKKIPFHQTNEKGAFILD
ncbi:competence protein ComEC [Winogradskyella epiphytica]|uniref:Competence protein ComEC n=1 Tax=Winogradskyella epiphytica TaxID=262005 RepID=A0A2V4YFU0_9FLAO|nr:ComEC/Rec2 family competence protein [Winogradskyella epiphytica]PYE82783.1 competence protein ComEC [Winogradskyella epiphytica]GGW53585.1 competence protein ComEC [Winogradskyella epiphytica]